MAKHSDSTIPSSPAHPDDAMLRKDADADALDRRSVIKGVAALGAVAGLLTSSDAEARVIRDASFTHGVASGDPTASSVILWTRAVSNPAVDFSVRWTVSSTPDMQSVVRTGTAMALAARDYTVKVDADGLQPGRTYYYQFTYSGVASPVGVTRTLPVGDVANVKLAVFSCTFFAKGYFNVYREAAKRDDIDACLHLGDYIYEYAPGQYVTPASAAKVVTEPRAAQLVPQKEILTLTDYRQRYANARSDADLQELHRKTAWIVIWDDHETANNSWRDGAENHTPATEGPWSARVSAALQAYYEWLPIREPASGNLRQGYRSFDFGNLARLMMLETRLLARDEQLSPQVYVANWTAALQGKAYPADLRADGTPRTFIGAEQTAWLNNAAVGSTQTWQLFGNQVFLHYEAAPDILNSARLTAGDRLRLLNLLEQVFPGQAQTIAQLGAVGLPLPDLADNWTGYPTERDAMYALLARCRNPIVLTGDSHNAWGVNLRRRTASGHQSIGVEFAGASVTSPGYEETAPVITPDKTAGLVMDATQILDQMVYANTAQRGYMLVDITPQRVRNEWHFVDTVFSPLYTARLERTAEVTPGARKITSLT